MGENINLILYNTKHTIQNYKLRKRLSPGGGSLAEVLLGRGGAADWLETLRTSSRANNEQTCVGDVDIWSQNTELLRNEQIR